MSRKSGTKIEKLRFPAIMCSSLSLKSKPSIKSISTQQYLKIISA